ncbi:hypothetical protein Athai_30600 [Actinocatenispora thailandica]|uniref:Uncharacterized protein n=1 Tax=Actinocatenispora thailandica TaxID=227318 RepID=A0A7R7HWX1_9ACTN|nr:hypothetical protein [Actinocatenispora thailandica]BCJ35557.1 hypothetical protein Athai_30600 [Actinocatenispora thailandica]
MTEEAQPAAPRPGPHLFGAGPTASRPASGTPGSATDHGSPAENGPEQAPVSATGSPAQEETHPEPADPGAPLRAAVGGLEPTGEPRVDEALAVLEELAGRPTGDQVAGYEQVHRSLQDVLAAVDDA